MHSLARLVWMGPWWKESKFVKEDKTTNKSDSIHTNETLLSSNRLELSLWPLTHVFKKIETTMRWNCMFFTVFLTIKISSQNVSITLLQISLKLQEHRDRYCRKKLPWTILEEQFPVPRYTAASKIGNSVISLLWQLRCRCNPNHNKFLSTSNTTAVAIFPNLWIWRHS